MKKVQLDWFVVFLGNGITYDTNTDNKTLDNSLKIKEVINGG